RERNRAFGQAARVHVDQARVFDARIAIGGGDDAAGPVDVLAVLLRVHIAAVGDARGAAGIAGQRLDAGGAVVAQGGDVAAVVDRGHAVERTAGDVDAGSHDRVVQAAGLDRAAVVRVRVAAGLHVDAVGVVAVGVDIAGIGDAGAATVARSGVDAERIAAAERDGADRAVVGDRGQVVALGFDACRPGRARREDVAAFAVGDLDVRTRGEDSVAQRVVRIGVDGPGIGDSDVPAVGISVDTDDVARALRIDRTAVVERDVAGAVGVDAVGGIGGEVGEVGDPDVAGPVGQDAGAAGTRHHGAGRFVADDEGQVLDRGRDGAGEVAVAVHDVADRGGAIAGDGHAAACEGEG